MTKPPTIRIFIGAKIDHESERVTPKSLLRLLSNGAPDSVMASVLTAMETNAEFAPAVQAAALRSYTEGTDAPFLSLISDAAQVDPTFRSELKEFVAETLQTGTAQDRASAMRIMAAVAQHWNSEDLNLVFSSLFIPSRKFVLRTCPEKQVNGHRMYTSKSLTIRTLVDQERFVE